MRPDPQYGVPLSVANIPLELPIAPIYGVTPSDKYIPIAVDNDGKLAIGNVTISGPVTINDVVIKGVDPANGNTSEDVSVVNWGINGYALRSSIFYQGNALVINPDGSININPTEVIPVSIDHNTDSIAIYGTDGTTDRFIKTDSSGDLQVGIVGTPTVLQGTTPWVVTSSISTTAIVTAVVVGTSATGLLSTNLNRKGFAVQCTDQIVFVKLDSTVTTGLYSYELPKKGILEIENFCGPVSAIVASGSTTIMVTEKI